MVYVVTHHIFQCEEGGANPTSMLQLLWRDLKNIR